MTIPTQHSPISCRYWIQSDLHNTRDGVNGETQSENIFHKYLPDMLVIFSPPDIDVELVTWRRGCKVDMSQTIYYSHYVIVMTQMMVGNYWVQMLPSPRALVIIIKDGLVRGERLHAGYQVPRYKHLQQHNKVFIWEHERRGAVHHHDYPLYSWIFYITLLV